MLGFFDDYIEGEPDDSFDGSNDVFTVGSYLETLLALFYGTNEVEPDDSFDGSNDGFIVRQSKLQSYSLITSYRINRLRFHKN